MLRPARHGGGNPVAGGAQAGHGGGRALPVTGQQPLLSALRNPVGGALAAVGRGGGYQVDAAVPQSLHAAQQGGDVAGIGDLLQDRCHGERARRNHLVDAPPTLGGQGRAHACDHLRRGDCRAVYRQRIGEGERPRWAYGLH